MPQSHTDSPAPPKAGPPLDPSLFRRVPALRRHAAVCLVVAALTAAVIIGQTETLANGLSRLVDGDASAVQPLVIALAVIGLARVAIRFIVDSSSAATMVHLRAVVTSDVLRQTDALAGDAAATVAPTRVAALITSGVDAIDPWVRTVVPAVFVAAVVPPVVGLRILLADWISALILVVAVTAIPIFMVLIGRYTDTRQRRQWATLQRLGAHFHDVLSGLETLRLFGRADAQVDAVRRVTEQYRVAVIRTLRVAFLSAAALELLATLSVALVAVTAGARLADGGVTLSTALIVLLLAPECSLPLRRVGAAFHASIAGADAARDLDEFDELATSADGPVDRLDAADQQLAGAHAVSVDDATLVDDRGVRLAPTSFHAAPGELIALVGPSGAGKSTVLAAITGDLAADGTISLFGTSVTDLQRTERRRLTTVIPQRPLPLGDTVLESVSLALDPATRSTPAAVDRLVELLSRFGLGELADRPPGELSGGERQRVAVARSIAAVEFGTARVVIADEPTSQLDGASATIVIEALLHLADRGASVIVATHDPALMERATRVVDIGATVAPPSKRPVVRRDEPTPSVRRDVPANAQLVPEPFLGDLVVHADRSAPAASLSSLRSTVSDLRWMRSLAPMPRPAIATARGLGILAEGCTLGLAVAAAWLIFRAAEHPSFADLALVAVAVRACGIGKGCFRYVERLASHDSVLAQLGSVRSVVVGRLADLVPGAIAPSRRGDALAAVVDDVDRLGDLELRVIGPAITAWTASIGAVIAVGVVAGPAVIPLVVAAVIAGVLVPIWVAAAGASTGSALIEAKAELSARTVRYTEVAAELSLHGAAPDSHADIIEASSHVGVLEHQRTAASITAGAIVAGLAPLTAAAAVAITGAVAPGDGPLLGVAVLVPFAVLELLAPSVAGAEAFGVIGASAARLRALLTTPDPVAEPTEDCGEPNGTDISFEHVALGWESAPSVLAGVDLWLPASSRTVIRGRSGIGKSTIAAALVGFLRPRNGTYRFGDSDTADVRSAVLRRHVGWVQQHPWLASTTLRENLRIADPAASDEQMADALDHAALGGWFAALPLGLDTELGISGVGISGGERQRLAIARQLLVDRDVVVLDEPTAHLDAATADQMMTGVLAATAGRTVVVISHDDDRFSASEGFSRVDVARGPASSSSMPNHRSGS